MIFGIRQGVVRHPAEARGEARDEAQHVAHGSAGRAWQAAREEARVLRHQIAAVGVAPPTLPRTEREPHQARIGGCRVPIGTPHGVRLAATITQPSPRAPACARFADACRTVPPPLREARRRQRTEQLPQAATETEEAARVLGEAHALLGFCRPRGRPSPLPNRPPPRARSTPKLT